MNGELKRMILLLVERIFQFGIILQFLVLETICHISSGKQMFT